MGFQAFVDRVNALMNKSQIPDSNVRFIQDGEKGRFIATFSDGTKIIGRPNSFKTTIKWGSGHTAMATL